jgi:cyclopropane fatty-acyl-phospholipid synthase-like methyltransferase
MDVEKPYSQACENNKMPILAVLRRTLAEAKQVLEIGSGTGQHAVYLSANLPHLQWHSSDVVDYHEGINQWIDDYPNANLHRPFEFKLGRDPWPSEHSFDAIYSANTAHIMLEHEVKALMQIVATNLPKRGLFCQYGPFKVDGKFTSQSNEDFHEKLIATGRGGYRDIDELAAWAPALTLEKVIEMPANNLMLVWSA